MRFIFFSLFIFISGFSFAQTDLQTSTFKVYGNCGMCQERIEEAIQMKGVKSGIWDMETKMLRVQFDPTKTDLTKIKKAIAKAGHDTEEFQAKQSTYDALHDCCHYDRYIDPNPKGTMRTILFPVKGNCEQCKDRIQSAAISAGAKSANWNAESGNLQASFDTSKTTATKIKQAIANAGHDNDEFTAPEKIYNSLPECCLYRPATNETGTTLEQQKFQTLTGVILNEDKKGKLSPLAGATIRCLQTAHQAIADEHGVFTMQCITPMDAEITFVGFEKDTVQISSAHSTQIVLRKNDADGKLTEVTVQSKRSPSYVSALNTFNTLKITSKELTKAACCNLSESFETSPSVDVSFSDAVTGIKQIQLLGLSGAYIQMLTENTPEIKGLAGSYGLTFIPGTWVESIDVTKGIGSVVNGYEGISGQINIEEKKSDHQDKLFINGYGNQNGRVEGNMTLAKPLSEYFSTGLLLHASSNLAKTDMNKDGFLDNPLGHQLNAISRWKYANQNGVFAQLSLKALTDKRIAGENDFDEKRDKLTTNKYGVGIDVQQLSATGKLGYVFPQTKYKSVGLVLNANDYKNDSYYGRRIYNSIQKSLYANLIYQSVINNSNHKFKTGMSWAFDQYDEQFSSFVYHRTENVPGAFVEYNYIIPSKFSAIVGLRADYHNEFKTIFTPRINLKYDFAARTNLRFSAGSGFRLSNPIAENIAFLNSARTLEIKGTNNNFGYGLKPEKAISFGLNFVHQFKAANNHNASFSIDAYRTDFKNQTVVDLYSDPSKVLIYDLDGKSYANNIQTEFSFSPIHDLTAKFAYRWIDAKTTYKGKLLEKPFVAKHRAFLNLAYELGNDWAFDWTTQWLGKKKIPQTGLQNIDQHFGEYSPSFIQMSAQVTKKFGTKWEVYSGLENITNYIQKYAIVDNDQPFSSNFDASKIWGPINGRMIYVGFRFTKK